jgi:hypothetical protein
MLNNKRFGHKTAVALVIVILSAVFALLYFTKATGVPFKSIQETDVLAILTSMFVVAVFMERSIEAILTPVRVPDRQKIERDLEDYKREAKTDETKIKDVIAKQRELDTYRLKTAQRAYWLSFSFGLVISLVGIRTLAGLVEPDELQKLGDLHRTMFSFVDIILTGGVIAGGSAAINKIASAISNFFKLKSATDSKVSDDTSSAP